eukprot:TRINITY_DN22021_c0_g1_i1.p1 TRINITY_DN22021_c0_g1~~TRINITY_DN22021_c0_g1_i1.p1  ORF type:complete len:145 (-),score=21.07 TRINITY_DN22021_c0_g1_i1:252-686(-)
MVSAWQKRLAPAALLLCGLAVGEPQAPATAPGQSIYRNPPPPPPVDTDAEMQTAKARHLSALGTSTVHHEQGAWLYGDYKEIMEYDDPVACSRACEDDSECYHWNFHVQRHRCQLKGPTAGFNADKSDWVSGNAARYRPRPDEL